MHIRPSILSSIFPIHAYAKVATPNPKRHTRSAVFRGFQKSHSVPKACSPSLRHPCIISSFPVAFDVMKTTSAPNRVHVSRSNAMVSGRPPRFFESQSIMRSGSMCFLIRFVMVGPKVFSWSDPIQMRNQSGDWMQVESAAPMPVPVQMRMPRLNMAEAWPTPAVMVVSICFSERVTRVTHRT
jgi:hypothetical protein